MLGKCRPPVHYFERYDVENVHFLMHTNDFEPIDMVVVRKAVAVGWVGHRSITCVPKLAHNVGEPLAAACGCLHEACLEKITAQGLGLLFSLTAPRTALLPCVYRKFRPWMQSLDDRKGGMVSSHH